MWSHMMTFFMEPEGLAAACSSTVSGHTPPAAITALLPTDPQCRAPARRSEHFRILQTAVAIFVRQMQMLGGQSDMEIYLIDYARLYNHAQARVVDLMVTMENMKLSSVWRELTGRSLSLDWTPPNHAAVPARCRVWTGKSSLDGLTLTKLVLMPNTRVRYRMERSLTATYEQFPADQSWMATPKDLRAMWANVGLVTVGWLPCNKIACVYRCGILF